MKLHIVHLVLANAPLDRGAQPYQDIDLLLRLRNLIVHAKPESVHLLGPEETPPPPTGVVAEFLSRRVITGHDHSHGSWSAHLLKRPVAEWAVATATTGFQWVAVLPQDPILLQAFSFFHRAPLDAT